MKRKIPCLNKKTKTNHVLLSCLCQTVELGRTGLIPALGGRASSSGWATKDVSSAAQSEVWARGTRKVGEGKYNQRIRNHSGIVLLKAKQQLQNSANSLVVPRNHAHVKTREGSLRTGTTTYSVSHHVRCGFRTRLPPPRSSPPRRKRGGAWVREPRAPAGTCEATITRRPASEGTCVLARSSAGPKETGEAFEPQPHR